MSCLLKHLARKIKSNVNRRFDPSSIILKIEVVNVNAKVVIYAYWNTIHSKLNLNNNFEININDLNLENDAWCIETSIDNTLNLSC